ncbi:hypothetical protein C8K61_108137 [Pseudomonas sp. GV071]|nr:hypothetical protein C8K61_108137 [Pseudomonas sp. GV071]
MGRGSSGAQKNFDLLSDSFAVFSLLIRLVNKAPHFSTSAMVKELHMKQPIRPDEGRVALGLDNVQGGYNVAAQMMEGQA